MPGKYTDGYTKNAQKAKFIRHRDVKMKDSELRKEAKIQKLMCEGVCGRCREKVQWRFKFDKYKPLKAVATCQQCKHKAVTKAYRTMCDKCAVERNVCPSCCNTITSDIAESYPIGESEEACTEETGEFVGEAVPRESVSSDQSVPPTVELEAGISDSMDVGGQVTEENSTWDEQKFLNVAASKYSKQRRTGKEG